MGSHLSINKCYSRLTDEDKAVIREVGLGHSDTDCIDNLKMKPTQFNRIVHGVRCKLGCNSRTQLCAVAWIMGLVKPNDFTKIHSRINQLVEQ